MTIELKIPEAGESITEVQIGQWRKSEGDSVEQDENVAEIETDKASMELPSPAAGTVEKILKQQGEFVGVGESIATIREGGDGKAPKNNEEKSAKNDTDKPAKKSNKVKEILALQE